MTSPVGSEGEVMRRGEKIPVRAPSLLTRLSDLVAKENNETCS
jgi:hypothetical protein